MYGAETARIQVKGPEFESQFSYLPAMCVLSVFYEGLKWDVVIGKSKWWHIKHLIITGEIQWHIWKLSEQSSPEQASNKYQSLSFYLFLCVCEEDCPWANICCQSSSILRGMPPQHGLMSSVRSTPGIWTLEPWAAEAEHTNYYATGPAPIPFLLDNSPLPFSNTLSPIHDLCNG